MFAQRVVGLTIVVLILNVLKTNSARSNSCKRFIDYYFIDISKNCYYNPDVFASTPEILTRHVGTYENHTVTTEDGYILTLFRIPKKDPKGVVILQHPVTSDSSIYVGENNQSLAFLLAEQGYDVWLPNNRGTPYSIKHVNLTSSDFAYWNFSFHEIGLYDYSSIITYVKEETGTSDIVNIGQSMGVTASIIYASLKPTEAKNSIKVFIGMAPSVYFKYMRSPVRFLAILAPFFEEILNFFQIGSLFQYRSLEYYISKILVYIPMKEVFVILGQLVCGWTPNQFQPELFNLLYSQNPRSFSTKILYHYAQLINSGGIFQTYDYGREKNRLYYGSATPLEYPIKNITVPVYLVTSASDAITTLKDSEILYSKLSDEARIYGKLDVSGLNHVDFFVGKDRVTKVYNPILSLLNKIL